MKMKWCLWLFGFGVLAGAVACAPNLEMKKSQEQAHLKIGEAYIKQGDYTAALRALLDAEKIYPDDPVLQDHLGWTYMQKGLYDSAVSHFEKSIRLNPDFAPARNHLGTAYMAKGDWNAAIRTFEELIGSNQYVLYATPHYPLNNTGYAYFNKKAYATAETYFRRALDMQPRFVPALRGLGQTLLAEGKIAAAVEVLERAVEIEPRFAPAQFDLGRAHEHRGNFGKAISAYEKVLALVPGTPLSQQASEALERLR